MCGYLADKQKNAKSFDGEKLPIEKITEIENTPFTFDRVVVRDMAGKYGPRRVAISDITLVTGEKVTVFFDKSVIVKEIEEGIRDGHDWTADGINYVVEKVMKKAGDGSYWNIREA